MKKLVFGFILKTALVFAALYISVSFVNVAEKLSRARRDYAELTEALAAQRQENDELRDMVENGITDDYIIKKARSYGYVLPDETIYADIFGK